METVSLWILKKAPAWFVSWSFRKIFGKKNLDVFGRILELPKWEKVSYNSPEKWIYKDDNSFVIEISDESKDFKEPWTECFPDKDSKAVEVYLKIGGELATKPISFVGVDGFRYFVPCPKISSVHEQRYFYYEKNSIEYKVFKIIGNVSYMYTDKSLEEFAKRCKIIIK